jgi:hypothetical protein
VGLRDHRLDLLQPRQPPQRHRRALPAQEEEQQGHEAAVVVARWATPPTTTAACLSVCVFLWATGWERGLLTRFNHTHTRARARDQAANDPAGDDTSTDFLILPPKHTHTHTHNKFTTPHTVLPEDGPAGAVALVELSRKSGLPLGVLASAASKDKKEGAGPTLDGACMGVRACGWVEWWVGVRTCKGL